MTYEDFLKNKIAIAKLEGFEVTLSDLPAVLKPHQADIVRWACKGGSRAIFAQFGLGKTHLMLTNSVGVIDSDYRGEIRGVFQQTRMAGGEYKIGDRFCQLVLVPIPEVTLNEVPSLSETSRGVGGYGSTGN